MSNPVKDALRISCLLIRSSLSKACQQEKSRKICQQIKALEAYRQAKYIALYQAFNKEVDLQDIWNTAPFHGKFCYFPVIDSQHLEFLPATPKTPFVDNKYGIPEPCVDKEKAVSDENLDIIFMPLAGFDIFGTRLGMGKGYYDKSLQNAGTCLKIGIAYECQKVDYIPPDPWDISLDLVITEDAIYTFTK